MAEVVDLRGRERPVSPVPVLADLTGRRARALTRAGRVVAGVFCVWFAGLALAGLGILPAGVVPLGGQVSPAPAAIKAQVRPIAPTRADLAKAVPSSASAGSRIGAGNAIATTRPGGQPGSTAPSAARAGGAGPGGLGVKRGGTGGASTTGTGTGAGTTTGGGTTAGGGTTSTSAHGKSTAPGQTRKLLNPGHTKTSPLGHSGSPPGQLKQTTTVPTTTTPGKSGSSPGHTLPHGSGGGHNS